MPSYDMYYHGISGLLVPKFIASKEIHPKINTFIDTLPDLAIKLEESMADIKNSRKVFTDAMQSLAGLLESVYAQGLEAEANRINRSAQNDNQLPFLQQIFKPFLTDVLSLSVEMQKAQNVESESKDEGPSKIELYVNTAKSVSAVSNLMADGLFEPAGVLLSNLVEHYPSTTVFKNLLELFNAGKHDEAKSQISAINEKFNKTLDDLVGTDFTKIILAVDDMPEILSFVNNALKSHYKVFPTPGAKAALKVMEAHKPNLFILDIDMPEMDGFELATAIRKHPDHSTTPIIFLTGNSSREHISKATAVGGNEFIVKPASHGHLLAKVGGFLNKEV